MRLEPPSWWYRAEPDLTARLLAPAGALYGLAGRVRMAAARAYRPKIPVICIGNLTTGGAGKTPTAIEVVQHLRRQRETPVFLTRGYGGRLEGPHFVDIGRDTPDLTGDEPLLLARHAPTVIARNRAKGAKAIEDYGATVIVMDDGFQNPHIAKDASILVVDAARGIGNGLVLPAGPLRLPLGWQLSKADSILILGRNGRGSPVDPSFPAGFPGDVMRGEVTPAGDTSWLRGRAVLAFAGIGRPDKLFDTLEAAGAKLVARRPFPDHHVYVEHEARGLVEEARAFGAQLVTTEKDAVRIRGNGMLAELSREARPLPVRVALASPDRRKLEGVIDMALRQRGGGAAG